jgi:unsaturated pyranuronate lyase
MPKLVGFSRFAALPEEEIGEKISRRILSGDQGMVVWWSIEAGVHVEPHSHPNEQIVWMLKGKMEFRLDSEQRVCGQGDVIVIPGGTEHEGWFREDSEVIDFFAPSARRLPTRRQTRLHERRLNARDGGQTVGPSPNIGVSRVKSPPVVPRWFLACMLGVG